MGRLIDADELIDRIIEDCNGFQPQAYHICKIINQCEPDYDVDKVVEQLEELKVDEKETKEQIHHNLMMDIAIDIVKSGGKE